MNCTFLNVLSLYQYDVRSLTAILISFYQDGEEYVRKRIRKLVEVIGKIEVVIFNSDWSDWSASHQQFTCQFVIGQFVIGLFNKPITIKVEL